MSNCISDGSGSKFQGSEPEQLGYRRWSVEVGGHESWLGWHVVAIKSKVHFTAYRLSLGAARSKL